VLAADRAIALGQRIDVAVDLERDFSAVASALVAHRQFSVLCHF
jgi:hypothetical protein